MLLCLIVTLLSPVANGYVRKKIKKDGKDTNTVIRWPCREIPYWINKDGSPDLTFEEVEKAVKESFQVWQDVECANIKFSYMGKTDIKEVAEDQYNVIAFMKEGEKLPINFQEGQLARAYTWSVPEKGYIEEAEIFFNNINYQFSVTDDKDKVIVDIKNTLIHEIGHLLGFRHSDIEGAVMFAEAQKGELSKRTLSDDDKKALCDTYPKDQPIFDIAEGEEKSCMPSANGSDKNGSNDSSGGGGGCSLNAMAGTAPMGMSLIMLLLITTFWAGRRFLSRKR